MARALQDMEQLIQKYEENGPAKLYYALNRKAWEVADLLNDLNYKDVDLEDAKDKRFERVLKLCESATKMAESVKVLEGIAGITGNEDKDVKKIKPVNPQLVAKGEFE